MRMRTAIGRVFAWVAIAGLLLAPMARPTMAMDTPTGMEAAAASDSATADAMDQMPFCPGKTSLPDCSKDCPLMALCVSALLHLASQTSFACSARHREHHFAGRFPGTSERRRSSPAKTSQSLVDRL